jgi:tRNA(fMet)-specific endonuclease VapC
VIRFLVDTDICIYALKGRSASLADSFEANKGSIATSDITLFELAYGAEKYAEPKLRTEIIEAFAARLEVFPFDTKAAFHAAEIRASLQRQGTPIGNFDLLIAGIARSRSLIVVTKNTREFSRVDGLRLETWT